MNYTKSIIPFSALVVASSKVWLFASKNSGGISTAINLASILAGRGSAGQYEALGIAVGVAAWMTSYKTDPKELSEQIAETQKVVDSVRSASKMQHCRFVLGLGLALAVAETPTLIKGWQNMPTMDVRPNNAGFWEIAHSLEQEATVHSAAKPTLRRTAPSSTRPYTRFDVSEPLGSFAPVPSNLEEGLALGGEQGLPGAALDMPAISAKSTRLNATSTEVFNPASCQVQSQVEEPSENRNFNSLPPRSSEANASVPSSRPICLRQDQ